MCIIRQGRWRGRAAVGGFRDARCAASVAGDVIPVIAQFSVIDDSVAAASIVAVCPAGVWRRVVIEASLIALFTCIDDIITAMRAPAVGPAGVGNGI